MLHSNGLFHEPPASSAEENATHSVTVKVMKRLLDGDGMKMVSEWENLYQEEADQFCWSMIATTSQFRECIDMLDERGPRGTFVAQIESDGEGYCEMDESEWK